MHKVRSLVVGVSLITAVLWLGESASTQQGPQNPCELGDATVLTQEGSAMVQQWTMPDDPVWFSQTLPSSATYARFRDAIQSGGADVVRPISYPAEQPRSRAELERWEKEERNLGLMFDGAGEVRPVRCLEAALFAWQDSRFPQLSRRTEFMAHVLRRDHMLTVIAGASDLPAPPKQVYAFDIVATYVAKAWEYVALLHNHPLQIHHRKPVFVLGVPAPSTNDVQLGRGLIERLNLQELWVTNGMYTGVIRANDLSRFSTPD